MLGNHDVGGLDVTVDDAAAMGVLQRRQNAVGDPDGVGRRERSRPSGNGLQRFATNQLQHDEKVCA